MSTLLALALAAGTVGPPAPVSARIEGIGLVEFFRLFRPEEGRLGVTVTFAAILELLREQLVEIAQAEPYQPLYVRRIDPDPETAVIDDVQITTA